MNLQKTFSLYNRKYFGNRLPKCQVRWNKKLLRRGYMGEADGCGRLLKRPTIIIAIELKRLQRVAKITLLHEMVHVLLDARGLSTESLNHGPRFQREMLRLAKCGAFNKLW